MIFNTEVYKKAGLTPEEFVTLLHVHSKDYSTLTEDLVKPMLEADLLTTVKAKNASQTLCSTVRLSKKSKQFLRDLEIPGISDEVKATAFEMQRLYNARGCEDKASGAIMKKTIFWLACLMSEMDVTPERIIQTTESYLFNTDKTYVMALNNFVFKPSNVFVTRFNSMDSKLVQLLK